MKRTFKKRIAFVLSLVMLLTGMNLFVAAAGIVAGDINGDKKVNTKDLTRLMRYIAAEGEGVEVVEEALDTNGDNSVNTMDLTHLMRYLAGDDVVIYPIETEDPTEPSDPSVTQYTVTFKDYDGTVLKTETVNEGESATPPADPEREGYLFSGWDYSFSSIYNDLIVTATYEKNDEPTIRIEKVSAKAGDEVEVRVFVENNPGVAGAIMKLSYNESLTLKKATLGTAFSAIDFTPPGVLSNPCNLTWDSLDTMATDNGVLVTLKFTVSNNVVDGDTLMINMSYRPRDIFDEDGNAVDFNMISGSVTIH